jgi:lambda family phage portal protein
MPKKSLPSVKELLGEATASPARRASATPDLPQPSGESGVAQPGAIAGGAYEGANQFSRELATWRPSFASADMDLLSQKPLADARSRDVLRNDAFVQGGAAVHKDNIVGPVYTLNAKPAYGILGFDEDWASDFQIEVEEKFSLWANSLENWVDASGVKNLTEMVRLAVQQITMGGEVLAVAEYIRGGNRPFRTAIQMIDPDRLSNPYAQANTARMKGGIEFDRLGKPIRYFIREAHPTDYLLADNMRWRTVEAKKPWGRQQVIHIYEQNRPGQSRGIADMVAALKELRITKQFRDIVLQNAVLNATFAATIESDMPTEAFAGLGAADTPEEVINGYATGFFSALEEFHGSGKGLTLNGVRIPHLFPGTKFSMLPAGQGGPLGTEFEQSLLRYIAAALGISYEQLSRDFTQTNYSSARAALNETWKFMLTRKHLVADRFATHVYALWLEEAIDKGFIETLAGQDPDFFYRPLHKEALTRCAWIGASRGQIDELKETQAAALRLKYRLSTQEDEAARLGKDWREVNAQLQREKADLEDRGLWAEVTDNSMNAASGSPQEREADAEPEDGSEDNTDV